MKTLKDLLIFNISQINFVVEIIPAARISFFVFDFNFFLLFSQYTK